MAEQSRRGVVAALLRGLAAAVGATLLGMLILAALVVWAALSDTALLKETHDAARELLKSPDSADARAVIARAETLFAERLHDVAMN